MSNSIQHPIAFVLSGGASLGAVQAGMLRALFEKKIFPDFFVGTSAGAINAAMACLNYSETGLSKLDDIWVSLQTKDIFPDVLKRAFFTLFGKFESLASPKGLIHLFKENLPDNYEAVKIPTYFVATELLTGHINVLSKGHLHHNLLASAAIPGVFPPVTIDGHVFVDGALASNVPIGTALDLGAKTVFILDSSYSCAATKMPADYLSQILRTLNVLLQQQQQLILEKNLGMEVSIVYLPSVCPQFVLPHDFSHGRELIDLGYKIVKPFLENIFPLPRGVIGQRHYHS